MEDLRSTNFRLGLLLAGALAVGGVGCASRAGAPVEGERVIGGEEIPTGESMRENDMTDEAQENLDEARRVVREAVRTEGADVEAARAEARPLFQAALESAEQAIAADSTNPLGWYQAGMAEMGLEDYQEAARMMDRAQELRPVLQFELDPLRERTWIRLFNQAQPLLDAGDYEEAARIFEQADAIYEERPEVKIVLGQVYSALGRYEDAVDLFREALAIIESPQVELVDSATAEDWAEHARTLPLVMADALIAAEDYEEAVAQLRGLLADDPDNVVLARNLASVFLRMEQPDSAAVIYDQLLSRPDLSGADYYQIGVGLYNMEAHREAADAFAEAFSTRPMDRDAAEMWARSVQLTTSDMPEGEEPDSAMLAEQLQAAEEWLELDPYNRNAHLIAAQAANRLGDQDRARELVQAIENLPIVLDNLQLRHNPSGGGTALGQIINLTQPPGTEVTIEISFLGPGDQALGTETTTLALPAQDAAQAFQVELNSDEKISGYTYVVEGLVN